MLWKTRKNIYNNVEEKFIMDDLKSACTDFLSNMIEDTIYNLNLENTEYRKCRKNEIT